MPLTNIPLPYGLRDVKLKAFNAATGVLDAAWTDLPYSQTLSFGEAEDFEELRGDDKSVAYRGKGPQVEWELEAGGISLDAYAKLAGGAVVDSGVTPSQKRVYSKAGTDARPYLKIEGQVISDSGGDFHAVMYRCRVTGNIEGEFAEGQFFVTSLSGIAIPDPSTADKLYDFVQNETAAVIV